MTGRITSIAADPSDSTGNRIYVGTTGGGVWTSNNAAAAAVSSIVFTPLTDQVTALASAKDASISIGALTVQPGGTGVVLAGTGDPNDALDSYYGAGILRSTDGGATWSLIPKSSGLQTGTGGAGFSFAGAAFAGFAWSTVNPQVVVAAVSDSYEGDIVGASLTSASTPTVKICEGLYYSTDSGATWQLATIEDGTGANNLVQSAASPLLGPNGNAATSVVWNPLRNVFLAAIRFHGYYESADGITWTRLTNQPGINSVLCPTNPGVAGDTGCPVFRGALAANAANGDTFAWTVDINNQDQGLWQDVCAPASGACASGTIAFGTQWNTTAAAQGMDLSTAQGAATVVDGAYTLALAAAPSATASSGTLLLAGADDLWEAELPYALGGSWRNTTNSTTCMSAQVGEYQHALAWNASNPLEIFLGNDSGLWRSTDGIAETGPVCSSTDAGHFQNLNGSIGSLAEVESVAPAATNPYTILASAGVNGAAGIEETSSTFASTADWPQLITGDAGAAVLNPADNSSWYINDQAGVAIYLCSPLAPCTGSGSAAVPVVGEADVDSDGLTMPVPATFQVDALDMTKLLVATCRIWQGTPGGSDWTAISPVLAVADTAPPAASYPPSTPCDGNALVRSLVAMNLGNGSEVVYVGLYGAATFGANASGHILSGLYQPASSTSPAAWTWTDRTANPVTNDANPFNYYEFDISSLTIDAHDPTGNTVYATVEGMQNYGEDIQTVYRSTSGGAQWTAIDSNLPDAPVSALAIDPQSGQTVYLATDVGVFYTSEVTSCGVFGSNCWAPFGAGLPPAPVVALSAAAAHSSDPVLVAATYGRGIWQTTLWTAGTALAAASAAPASLTFTNQNLNTTSNAQTVTITNTGSVALTPTSIMYTGDFATSSAASADTCTGQSIASGASCTVGVVFTPQTAGALTGLMTIYANVYGGQLSVDLNGTGVASSSQVTISPASIPFGQIEENTVSPVESISVQNSGAAVSISGLTVSTPFVIPAGGNSCGATSLAASSDCAIQIEFAPTSAGTFTGLLTLTDAAGTQTVQLTGTSLASPTDVLNPTALSFPNTVENQVSSPETVTITNIGGVALTNLVLSITGPFQQTNQCGSQVAANGGICYIAVTFDPTQAGPLTGTLTVADALKTQTVALSGAGIAPPVLGVSPTSLTFTNNQPGVSSSPQTLTVTNTGGAALAGLGFTFSGAAASSYAYTTTCGTTLAAGASCTAQIVFTPSASGASAATLTISSSTAGVTAVAVPINASGQQTGGLVATPAVLNFSAVPLGQTSAAQTVTLTNSTASVIDAVTLAIAAPFSIAQNGCAGTLAAGASCTAEIVFKPTAGGSASGTLTASASGVPPATVALSGAGFNFTVVFVGAAAQMVTAGQTATYSLVVTPTGASGTFTFACGTLPTGALCLFNPTTETISAGVQGNLEAQISTGSATAKLVRPGRWPVLPLVCGVLLLPLALKRRRSILLPALLFAVLATGVSSCVSSGGGSGGSGGSGSQGGGSGTPTGTYTIPITVSANGLSQTVSATLTVD